MTGRDATKLAIAVLGDEPGASRRAKDIAGAYLDLLRATRAYFAQSLPYENDAEAAAASDALRSILHGPRDAS